MHQDAIVIEGATRQEAILVSNVVESREVSNIPINLVKQFVSQYILPFAHGSKAKCNRTKVIGKSLFKGLQQVVVGIFPTILITTLGTNTTGVCSV